MATRRGEKGAQIKGGLNWRGMDEGLKETRIKYDIKLLSGA
jgi:hypothetical protein